MQDLAIVVSEDLRQIEALRATLEASLSCIATLQDDIAARHENLGNLNALETLLCVVRDLELIDNNELKTQLLEVFTHLKDRNYATSTEIDSFNITFRNAVLTNFRIRFSYDSDDSRKLGMSNDFFGLLSQGSFYANMYLRQLSDISAGYHAVGELAQLELVGS